MLGRTTRTFTLQRDDLFKRVSGDRVTNEQRPDGRGSCAMDRNKTAAQNRGLSKDATPTEMSRTSYKAKFWPVSELVIHRISRDGVVLFDVDWEESYDRSWEPKSNILEELISPYLKRKISKDR